MATPEEQVPGNEGATPPVESGQPQPQPAAAPTNLDWEGIPEELKGMSPGQFENVWGLMRQALSAQQHYAAGSAAPAPRAEAPPEPIDDRTFRERFEDNPEAVLDDYFQRRYGGAFETVATNALEGAIASAKTAIPDFDKFEAETRKVIQEINLPASMLKQEHVRQCYLIARGRVDEARAKAEKAKSPAVAAASEAPVKQSTKEQEVDLTPEQKEIAARLGMADNNYAPYRQWLARGRPRQMMEVPTSGKGHGKPSAKAQ